jgi:hypothetical protein
MKRLVGVFAVVSLALAGCGGSTCEDLKDVQDSAKEKQAPCPNSALEISTITVATCDASIDKCTDAEKDALSDYVSCVNKVDKCKVGSEDAFDSAVLACAVAADGKIGDTCENAVFPSALRPPAASYSFGVSR